MHKFGIGQTVSRFEDPRLVRGGGRYVDDIALPGMAFGYVLRSPHAQAKIRAIDVAAAKAAPGVLAVLTSAEWRASGWGDLPVPGGLKQRDGSPMYRPRYPALASERVRWVGDYVAFVVAETWAQAADAAELIAVDYEPLPAVVSTAEAPADGAPRVFDDCPNNICFVHLEGDKALTDAAFARAAHVVREHVVINRVTAVTMEPRGSIGDYNANDSRYTVYTTLQRAHPFRTELANVLKVPEAKIRVVAGDIGGSFGMKSAVYNEVALVLLASKLIGRPVKWVSTRSEAFLSDAQGRDNVTDAELALDADGTFLALRVKTVANVGAYLQTAMPAFVGNLGSLAGVYRTPAIHADVTAVFTNTNPVRPYRGNGRPEAAYVIERMIDLAADAIGIDPIELRQRNTIPSNALPFRTGLTFTYDSGDFAKNLEMARELADIDGFPDRRFDARKRGKLRGLGVSNTIERAGAPSYEGAEIRFDRSGTVTLFCGAINQGQGHETVFKQILCDRLGLDPADIQYLQGDTDQVFFGEGTGGSRTATLGGAAVAAACDKVIDKARTIAAFALKAEPARVSFTDGVFSTSATNETLTLKEVARLAANPAKLPPRMEPGLVVTAVYRAEVENFPNGAHVCEVEIDRETGAVEIVRYSVVDDVGTVLNPLLLHGQITGGIAQGAGQILREDIRFDPATGELLTGSFMDYAMPRASDMCAIAIKSNPVPTKTNPLGVKGAGEAGTVGAMPAVANALVDALSEFGVRHIEMPATAEVIWRAMRDGKGA
ncbi:MAG TPA: xanthine dehydrogenase family protein molybdopterin-binding subunit [Xanthobacteraceae bacterium]|nr:xanthine dehydrogenase family protein molybdopterin-binding subunit [Xanthobacteraceae bacterium]